MSNNVMTLLEAALKNPNLQQQLHEASTPDRFVNIAAENGYTLDSHELAQTLGKFHTVFGQMVESMLDNMPTALENNSLAKTSSIEKIAGANLDLVKQIIARAEAFDSEGFINLFTDHPVYQFGNFDVCFDQQSIKQSAENFFSQFSAVYHEIKQIWEVGHLVFVEMDVSYWRKDNSHISLPCTNIFRIEGDKFSEVRIFMDVNPVFDTSIAVPSSASVMTASADKTLVAPGMMKQYYAQHPEGQQLIADGFVPQWSITGPKWEIASINSPVNKIDLVMEMEQAGGEFNWDYFQTFFTDNVMFKVGASEEGYGWQTIANYLQWLYGIAEPQLPFTFRGTWDLPGTVIVEMDAKYVRRSDQKPITFPCTDILRFDENNKVIEWRVYPDQSELWMEHLKPQAI
jgi:limonene-1,2-epoxide hydrolase